jgi:acyl-CoA thioesterase-1
MGIITLNASDPPRILIIGDSITAGYNLPPEHAYPSLLQKKITAEGLPFIVQNAGQSGDTSAGGLRRVRWLLRSGAPEVAIIALGANDGLRGLDPAMMQANLEGIVDSLRESNPAIRIILAGMRMPASMGETYVRDYEAAFTAVVNRRNINWIPFLLEEVAGIAALNLADGIHPNAEGQARIAATVWEHLRPLLR